MTLRETVRQMPPHLNGMFVTPKNIDETDQTAEFYVVGGFEYGVCTWRTLRVTILYVSRHIPHREMCMASNCLAYNINRWDAKMDRFMKVVNRTSYGVVIPGNGNLYCWRPAEAVLLRESCGDGTGSGTGRHWSDAVWYKGRHASLYPGLFIPEEYEEDGYAVFGGLVCREWDLRMHPLMRHCQAGSREETGRHSESAGYL